MIKKLTNTLFSIFILFAFWEALLYLKFVSPIFFPSPFKIITHIFTEINSSDSALNFNILMSLKRLVIASLITIPLAIILSIFIFINPIVKSLLSPLLTIFYPIPKLAIYPLLLLVLGIGDAAKILIISFGIFFLVLFNTLLGFENLKSQGYLLIAQVYKISMKDFLIRVLLKGAYAEIFEGIKLGLGYGLTMIIASESIMGQNGIGYILWNGWDQFKIIDVYSGLFIISFFGTVVFSFFELAKLSLDKKYYGQKF